MKVDLDAAVKNAKTYDYTAHPEILDLANTVMDLAIELRAARKVVEAARATLSFTDIGCGCDLQVNWICGPCALDKYLKELDGENV